MNIKKLLMGSIAGGIVFFLLGWLCYGNLFMDFFKNNTSGPVIGVNRTNMIIWIIFLGDLAHGSLLSYIIGKANVHSPGSGLITGGVIGFLSSAGYDLIMYATTNMGNKFAVMADVAIVTVMAAIAGAVIGLIYGMGKNPE